MSILDPNFDIDEKTLVQEQMIAEQVLKYVEHSSILLFDPHDEFNLNSLRDKLEGVAHYYDLAQCKAGDYVDFVNRYVFPLVNGQIDHLLVDNIDKIPDIEDKDDFENLLRFLAKGEDYDPFQNFTYTDEDKRIKRIGTIDFEQYKNRLIMRCAEVPEFLQSFTCIIVDCRFFALYVHQYLELAQIDRPLMLIFEGEVGHSNTCLDECKRWLHEMFSSVDSLGHPFKQGNKYFIDSNGDTQKISDHPEILNQVVLPESVAQETDFLLIHRYVDQFNYDAALKYALDIVSEHHLPVIYLANGYERDQNPSVDLQGFEINIIV